MALVIAVKVQPVAGKSGPVLDKDGNLKWFLKSPAEDGKANNELIKSIAYFLKISIENIEIIAGATARKKLIKIHASLTQVQFFQAIGITYKQQKIA